MDQNSQIVAAQVAGDFTLPKNKRNKLVFIAGGIGITPFRSMIKYLLDINEKRDIVLLYAVNTTDELAYLDILETAQQQLGIQVQYIVANATNNTPNNSVYPGYVNAEIIQKFIPDHHERTFYISGSHAMVESVNENLAELKVTKRYIKKDYFPGYDA